MQRLNSGRRVISGPNAAGVFVVGLIVAGSVVACGRSEPAPASSAYRPSNPVEATEARLTSTDGVRVPETRIAAVRWAEARQWWDSRRAHAEGGLAATPAQRAAWSHVGLPIFAHPDALATGIATGDQHWYALSATVPGGTLYLSGGIVETMLPEQLGGREPSLTAPASTINEAIVEVSWSEFGAHYSMSFECARPSEDPRCADTRWIESLVSGVSLVATPGLEGR